MSSDRDVFLAMKHLSLIDWPSLLIGWNRGWVSRDIVIDFAVDWLVTHPAETDDRVALMAGGELIDDAELKQLLVDVVRSSGFARSESDSVDRWRLAHLWALSQSKIDDNSRLDKLEELYADFGYPEDMAACSRYYVAPDGVGALQTNSERLSPLGAMQKVIRDLRSRFSGERAKGDL